jgi:hypothetical protein
MNRGSAEGNGYWRACFLGLVLLMVGSLAGLRPVLSVGLACLGWLVGVVVFVLLPNRSP